MCSRLNASWRCTRCETFVCSKCHAPLGTTRDEGHVCDPSAAESVSAIRSETTKCPGCAIPIHKINGCDQMYCVPPYGCGTVFSYRTGRRTNGVIHNPHYFQAMGAVNRPIGRNPADIPCGGLPTRDELATRCGVRGSYINTHGVLPGAASIAPELLSFLQIVRHLEAVELFRVRPPTEAETRRLRVSYMIGDMTEAAYKRQLRRREKQESKNRDVQQVLEMVVHTLTDEIRSFCVDGSLPQVVPCTNGIALLRYANDALTKIASCYKQSVPRFQLSTLSVVSSPHHLPSSHFNQRAGFD